MTSVTIILSFVIKAWKIVVYLNQSCDRNGILQIDSNFDWLDSK